MGERNDAPSGGGDGVGGTAAAVSTLLLSSLRSLSGGGGDAATVAAGGGGGKSSTRSRTSVVGVGAGGGVTVDRILGGAVTLGLSIALLRLSVQFWHLVWRRRRRRTTKKSGSSGEEEGDDEVTLPLPFSAYLPLFVHLALRRLMGGGDDEDGSEGSCSSSSDLDSCESDSPDSYFRAVHESTEGSIDESEFSIEGPIRGSCHCGAVRFALLRRQTKVGDEGSTMSAYDCPGKIRYPRVRLDAPSAEFQILEGEAYLQMYYDSVVAGPAGMDDEEEAVRGRRRRQSTAAHAFCNQCGVHVLHAPDSETDVLEVNANCLDWDPSTSGRPSRGGGRGRRRRMPPIEVTWRPRPAPSSRTSLGIGGGKKSSSSRGAATPSTEGTSASSSSFGSDFSLGVTPVVGGGDGRGGDTAAADRAVAVGSPPSASTRLASMAAVGRSPFPVVDHEDDGISTLAGDATYSSPHHTRGWASSPSPSSLSASRDSPSSTLTTPASVTSARRKKKTGGVDPVVREKVLYYMKRHLHTPTPTPPTTETTKAAEAEAEAETLVGSMGDAEDGHGEEEAAANPSEST